MKMCSTDSERMSATLEYNDVQDSSQPSILGTTDRVSDLMAESDELFVRLNEYKASNNNLQRKVFEQIVIMKAMTGSFKQLKRELNYIYDEINLLQKTDEEVLGSYGEDNTVVRRRIEKVAKSVPTIFVGMVMCISKAIPKWYR